MEGLSRITTVIPGTQMNLFASWLSISTNSWMFMSYILEPSQPKKFFDYIQHPSFDIAVDAVNTFKFFTEFNQRLLKSANCITRRQVVKESGLEVGKFDATGQQRVPARTPYRGRGQMPKVLSN